MRQIQGLRVILCIKLLKCIKSGVDPGFFEGGDAQGNTYAKCSKTHYQEV